MEGIRYNKIPFHTDMLSVLNFSHSRGYFPEQRVLRLKNLPTCTQIFLHICTQMYEICTKYVLHVCTQMYEIGTKYVRKAAYLYSKNLSTEDWTIFKDRSTELVTLIFLSNVLKLTIRNRKMFFSSAKH